MANNVILLKNTFYEALSDGWHLFFGSIHRSVPGTKLREVANFINFSESMDAGRKGVVVVPVDCSDKVFIEQFAKNLEAHKPYPYFFGVIFVLLKGAIADASSDMLTDTFWIETLDRFYDQAIPVQFVSCFGNDTNAHTFNLAAAISSLLRQIDSLDELKRLAIAVDDLEEKVTAFENAQARQSP